MAREVICPYCGEQAHKTSGKALHPNRRELHEKMFWICPPCDARVGCHEGTDIPLGTPADPATRGARMNAHISFDPLWQYGGMTRVEAYKWLAEQMNMPVSECHIGQMSIEQCEAIIRHVDALGKGNNK